MTDEPPPLIDVSDGLWARATADPLVPPPALFDRSTLQRWAECPQQAWLRARHRADAVGIDAVTGDEVHKVIGYAMRDRQANGEQPAEIRQGLIDNANHARPDVQPHVVQIIRKAAYVVTNVLCYGDGGRERHPDDLMAYDGGVADRTGQLSWEIMPARGTTAAVLITGEVDLLMATDSPSEVRLEDWKSGWRHWTAGDVLAAFQFQTYAWLIFRNFADVERIVVRVWNLRESESTSPVTFYRRDVDRIETRLRNTAKIAIEYRDAAEPPPAYPMIGKCELCPVAAHCTECAVPDIDIATDPIGYLKSYAVTAARAEQMKGRLSLKVRADGRDLIGDGLAFGQDKPKASRAKPLDLYECK